MDPLLALAEFEQQRWAAVGSASSAAALEQVRIEFLGKKQGRLKDLQSLLGKVPAEERPALGKRFNEVRDTVTAAWERRQQRCATAAGRDRD